MRTTLRRTHPYSSNIDIVSLRDKTVYTMFAPHITNIHRHQALTALEIEQDLKAVRELGGLLIKYKSDIDTQMALGEELASLLRTKDIRWIGVESNEWEEFGNIPFEALKKQVNSRFLSYDEWDEDKTRRLLHLIYSHQLIARYTWPKIFTSVRTNVLGHIELEEKMGELIGQLIKLGKIMLFMQQHQWASQAKAFHQLNIRSLERVPPRKVREVLTQIEEHGDTIIMLPYCSSVS